MSSVLPLACISDISEQYFYEHSILMIIVRFWILNKLRFYHPFSMIIIIYPI